MTVGFEQSAVELTASEAYALAEAGSGTVVDVRESWEWDGGHAAGATHIPLDAIPARHVELSKEQPVLLICASGNRSVTAARYLASLGYDARSVAGGTAAWAAERLPLEAGDAASR